MTAFADDKQIMECNSNLEVLINNMKQKLEMIIKWLKDSGLVVNDEKTETCLFYKRDHATITLNINNKNIRSKNVINVLGVLFDQK